MKPDIIMVGLRTGDSLNQAHMSFGDNDKAAMQRHRFLSAKFLIKPLQDARESPFKGVPWRMTSSV